MNKTRFIPVLLIVLSLLSSCGHQAPETEAEPQTENTVTAPSEVTEEKTFPDIVECAYLEGSLTTDSNTACKIHTRRYRTSPPDKAEYALYIEVDTGSQVIKKELESEVYACPESELFLGDVDGDGINEIFVHHHTGGVGGFGSWCTWVLKVENDDILVLFANYNEFDTGFESQLLDGYQLEVKNSITGYTLVYDVKDKYGEYIDNSTTRPDLSFYLDSFYVFEPKDIDGDGISEIQCKQYTSYFGHADYMGSACSVLKFNKEAQTFEVIDAWYEPYIQE